MPKYASEDNKRNAAAPSSKFPTNGIASGMSSNIPNPGLSKYNPDNIPITATNSFFIMVLFKFYGLTNLLSHIKTNWKVYVPTSLESPNRLS